MGKLNEIQQQSTQSYGGNSFTTKIEENTVVFDSAKDSFTFNDPVDAPALTINGQEVVPGEQVQADWNQNDSTKVDFIKNKPTIPDAQIQSDWNQNDSTAKDFIKNRICSEYELIYANEEDNQGSPTYFNFENPLNAGDVIYLYSKRNAEQGGAENIYGPITVVAYTQYDADGASFSSNEGTFSYTPSTFSAEGYNTTGKFSGNPGVVKFKIYRNVLNKIPAKFLSQADWNQNDNTAADYIKNRICSEIAEHYYVTNWTAESGTVAWPGEAIEAGKYYNFKYDSDYMNFDDNVLATSASGGIKLTALGSYSGVTLTYYPATNTCSFGGPSGGILNVYTPSNVTKIQSKFIPEVFKDTFNAGETSGSIEVDFSKNFYKVNNTTSINVNASGLPSNKTYTAKIWFGTSSTGNINIKDFVHFTDTGVTYTNVYATGGISQIVGGKQYLLTINYMKQVNGSSTGAIVTLSFEEVTYISY